MRITFLSHYFYPEGNAPASRTFEHCARWVQDGHDVTVITCVPNVPHGKAYEGYRNRLWPQTEMVDGIRVIRVWILLSPNAGFFMRTASYVSYLFSSLIALLFVRRPDVLIATSPQFFCGWAGVVGSYLKRCPFVLEIRDIWPESILAVGAMKKSVAIRILEWMELVMYRSATHIVTVGNGYRQKVAGKLGDGHTKDNISVITNGVNLTRFEVADKDHELLAELEFSNRFVCGYVGTLGMAHGLDVIIRAAMILKENGNSEIDVENIIYRRCL